MYEVFFEGMVSEDDYMKIEKKYYTISEVAQKYSVANSLIRYWERQFPSIKPCKNSQGTRQYSKIDIEEIDKVYKLVKEKGFTLSGAKQIIEKEKRGSNEAKNALISIARLEKVKSFLLEIKKDLE